jgi:hypothetical protein
MAVSVTRECPHYGWNMKAIQQTLFEEKRGPGGKRTTIDAPKGKKQCTKCRKSKLVAAFSKSKNAYDGRHPQCKQCTSDGAKLNRAKSKARALKRFYGMTETEYQTMLDQQGGVCAICQRTETRMQNGSIVHLSVDHDHKTGKIRALLCYRCNSGLAHFREDTALLEGAVAYLKKHSDQ